MIRRLLPAALAAALLLTGCAPAGEAAPSVPEPEPEPAVSEAAAPRRPANTELVVGYDPSAGFNPYLSTSQLVQQVSGLVFEKLVELTPDMELDYRVAESSEFSGDTVVLHLRGGLSFADGTPITVEDAAASLQAARACPRYADRFANVTSIRVQDGALTVKLARPDSLFPYLCDIPVMKASEVGLTLPCASGRYTYGEGRNELVRNSRSSLGGESPDHISLYPVEGFDEMVRGLAMGELNVYMASAKSTASASITSQTTYYKTNNLVFLGVNAEGPSPLVNTPQGRSLLSRLTDRRQLADKSFYGRAYPATGIINPFYACVTSQQVIQAEAEAVDPAAELPPLGYVYDPEDGYYRHADPAVGPLRLLVYTGNPYRKNAASLVQKQLADAGLQLILQQTDDFAAYISAVELGDFDLYIGEVKLYNNMDISPFWAGGTLSAHLARSESLLQAYDAFKANKSAAGSFEREFAAQLPFIPLLWRQGMVVTAQDVNGLAPSLSNPFYSLQDLSFGS